MNNLPAMTEEQRQELIEVARKEIKVWDDGGHYKELLQIALAALTAEKRLTVSVVQKNERLKGFNFDGYDSLPAGEHEFYSAPPAPVLKPIEAPGTKCIGWVRDTIREHDEKWKDAIRVAGYEVK